MRASSPLAVLAIGCAAVAVLAGCSSSGGSQPPAQSGPGTSGGGSLSGSITVYAASSLTEAFDTLGAQFEKANPGTKVTFTYDASSTLETEINQGANVDVFASAAPSNMAGVKSAVDPVDFVRNRMEIATPPSNPAHVTSVADLATSGTKVALCDPAVPCGATAQKVFANAKVSVKATASEPDVKSTLAAVESGEVDAGMVYVTDVLSAGKDVHGVPIPDDVNATTSYPIATLSGSQNATLAKAWVAYVRSAHGLKVLTDDGFLKP